jgi:hypothetical protein
MRWADVAVARPCAAVHGQGNGRVNLHTSDCMHDVGASAATCECTCKTQGTYAEVHTLGDSLCSET